MKKLLLFVALIPSLMQAQDANYNKWSIELDGGVTRPTDANTRGFATERIDFLVLNLGVRYMINTKFGIKADGGFQKLENNNDGSLEFESQYYRGSLQGVANIGTILNFRKTPILKYFGLLFHTGVGASFLSGEANSGPTRDDVLGNFILGFTPQLKLSNRVTLYGDISYIKHVKQGLTWDTASALGGSIVDGTLKNATIGLAINLGKNEVHADWAEDTNNIKELEELKARIANLETDLIDTDQDGVADYLDREPNTVSGVTVNTKGVTVDTNRNGIPDEFETALDRKYANDAPATIAAPANYADAIKKLLSDGYVNVYFNTASATPATYSLDAVNYLISYMKENASAQAELIGFADQRGSSSYNSSLSAKRAKKVYNLLIESGIDASRLSHRGDGEEASGNSTESLQLRRKVTFNLK